MYVCMVIHIARGRDPCMAHWIRFDRFDWMIPPLLSWIGSLGVLLVMQYFSPCDAAAVIGVMGVIGVITNQAQGEERTKGWISDRKQGARGSPSPPGIAGVGSPGPVRPARPQQSFHGARHRDKLRRHRGGCCTIGWSRPGRGALMSSARVV